MDPRSPASSPAPRQTRAAPHDSSQLLSDAPTPRPSMTGHLDSLPAHACVPGPAQTAPTLTPFSSSRGQRRILQPQSSHVSNSMLGPHPPSPFVSVQSSTPPASCYSPWPLSLPSEQSPLDAAASPGNLGPVQGTPSSRLAAAGRGSYPGSQSYGSSYIGCIEEEEAEEEGAARYRQQQQQGRGQHEQEARRRHLTRVSVDAAVAAEILPDGHSGCSGTGYGLGAEYGSNSLLTAVPEWQEGTGGAGTRGGRGGSRGSNGSSNAGQDVHGARQGATDGMRMHRVSMHGTAVQRQRASASFTGGGVSGGRDSNSGDGGGGGGGPAGSLRHAMHRWSDSGTAAFGWLGRLVSRISVRVSNGSSSRSSSNAGGPSGDGRSSFRSAGAPQQQPSDDGRGGIASPTTPAPSAPGSGWRRALWSPLLRAVSGEVPGQSPQQPTSPEGWVRGASNTSTSTASVASNGSDRDQVRFLRHMDSRLVHRRQFAQGGGAARPTGVTAGGEQQMPRLQQLPPKPQPRPQEQGTMQQQHHHHHPELQKQRGWDQPRPSMPGTSLAASAGATGSPAPPASPRIRAAFPTRTYTVRPQPPPIQEPPQQVASCKSLPNLHGNDSFRGNSARGTVQVPAHVRSGRSSVAPLGTPLVAPASAAVHEPKVQFAGALLPGTGSSRVNHPMGYSKSARGMEISETGSRGRGMLRGEWSERFVGGGGGGGSLAGGGVLPVLTAGDLEDDTYEELISSALHHQQHLYGDED